jgi:putative transposase
MLQNFETKWRQQGTGFYPCPPYLIKIDKPGLLIIMRKIKFELGKFYHIFNRGVEKRNIFNDDSDMWRFLQGLFLFNDINSSFGILYEVERKNNGRINFNLLKKFIDNYSDSREPLVRILADCLMPNHFHLIIEEIKDGGISCFMHKLGIGYVKYFNKKYNRVGGLFQGPFKAIEIKSDIYLQYLLAYINVINPGQLIEPELKEKGVIDIDKVLNFAEKYSFSTNLDYLGVRNSIIIEKGIFNDFFPDPVKYKEFVKEVLLSQKYNLINDLSFE